MYPIITSENFINMFNKLVDIKFDKFYDYDIDNFKLNIKKPEDEYSFEEATQNLFGSKCKLYINSMNMDLKSAIICIQPINLSLRNSLSSSYLYDQPIFLLWSKILGLYEMVNFNSYKSKNKQRPIFSYEDVKKSEFACIGKYNVFDLLINTIFSGSHCIGKSNGNMFQFTNMPNDEILVLNNWYYIDNITKELLKDF